MHVRLQLLFGGVGEEGGKCDRVWSLQTHCVGGGTDPNSPTVDIDQEAWINLQHKHL